MLASKTTAGLLYLGPTVTDKPRDGNGVLLYPDGSIYIGGVLAGRRSGKGTFVDALTVYEGYWLNDMRHGEGCFYFRGMINPVRAYRCKRAGEWSFGRRTRLQRYEPSTRTSWRDIFDLEGQLKSSDLVALPELGTPSSVTDEERVDMPSTATTVSTDALPDPSLGVLLKVSGYSELGTVVDTLDLNAPELLPALKRHYMSSSDLQAHTINSRPWIPLEYRDLATYVVPPEQIEFHAPARKCNCAWSCQKNTYLATWKGTRVVVRLYLGSLLNHSKWLLYVRTLLSLRVPNASMVLGVTRFAHCLHGLIIEFDSAPSLAEILYGDTDECVERRPHSVFSGAVFDDEVWLACEHVIALSPEILESCFGLQMRPLPTESTPTQVDFSTLRGSTKRLLRMASEILHNYRYLKARMLSASSVMQSDTSSLHLANVFLDDSLKVGVLGKNRMEECFSPVRLPNLTRGVCAICRQVVQNPRGLTATSFSPFYDNPPEDNAAISSMVWQLLTSKAPLGALSPTQRFGLETHFTDLRALLAIDAPTVIQNLFTALSSPHHSLSEVQAIMNETELKLVSRAEEALEQFLWGV